ncbi:MAG: helix-hairpin-helix domain-containing protein [Polyangiales bacterium]
MHDPQQIQQALEEITALFAFREGAKFKAQAYARAAELIEGWAADLSRLVESGRLTALEGIGPSLEKQIVALWNTGTSPLLEELRAETPPGAFALSRLPGLTPRRIRALSEGLGIRSLEDLREACVAQRVRTLAGFGPKVEQKLTEALAKQAEAGALPARLLLSEARPVAARLVAGLAETGFTAHVAGALRRGEETVDAIELVVVASPARAYAAVEALADVVQVDAASGRGLLTVGMPLQVHAADAERAGAALLLATGSAEHLAQLGARSEGGLAPLVAHAADEPALYRALGLAPVPPELRQGTDELARAATQSFDDLVTEDAIRGFVHCHTTYSDGRHDIEAMARAAEARGMAYITITDHSPTARYAGGVDHDRLLRQWDEIDRVQARVTIRILRGTESDILADGSLDYPDEVLDRLDVVIASVHARYRLDPKDMTARLVRAMKLPLFKIWGHALGRLLLRRAPIDCDVPAVLDALASSRGAIEINGDPRRLDLPPRWIPEARARGIPFVLSVDAHSTDGLGVLPYAVTMARRGGLTRAEVLNTLDADAFCAKVAPRVGGAA